jgi:hypothetical protein
LQAIKPKVKIMKIRIAVTVLSMFFYLAVKAQSGNADLKCDTSKFKFRAVSEIGFVSVLAHHIQLGQNGTYFDYVKDGGQDVLFPVFRFSIEMDVNKRNTFILLYQPLRIETQAFLRTDVVFNDIVFPASTGINCLYNFPFYRFSYLRELMPDNKKYKFAIGGSLQIRNATISFESTDGTRFTNNSGIGPVPAIKIRSKAQLNSCFYAEIEADGIYAPVSYLNGSDNEIVGAILDASMRMGAQINESCKLFLNLRYLGGGATGTDTGDVWPGDGYVKNWLNFLTISSGFMYQF